MKVHIKKVYYKNIRKGSEPCKYVARQPNGVNTSVFATIKLDPVLRKKKLKPIKNAMIRHEINEMRHWGEGKSGGHRFANSKEPYLTRVKLKGVSGFWKKIDSMKKKGEIK